jgi:hypothetical protein
VQSGFESRGRYSWRVRLAKRPPGSQPDSEGSNPSRVTHHMAPSIMGRFRGFHPRGAGSSPAGAAAGSPNSVWHRAHNPTNLGSIPAPQQRLAARQGRRDGEARHLFRCRSTAGRCPVKAAIGVRVPAPDHGAVAQPGQSARPSIWKPRVQISSVPPSSCARSTTDSCACLRSKRVKVRVLPGARQVG